MKIPYVFRHRFYEKSKKFKPKMRSPKAYPKNEPKFRFLDHFGLPKPFQNPFKIDKNPSKNHLKN